MAVTAFVPVRGGSKSIPLKNIKDFCGKPLVYWLVNALNQATVVDHVVVATDSDEIEKTVAGFAMPKVSVYRRLAENASDTASTESVMLEYLNGAGSHLPNSDHFILAQATTPFTEAKHLEEAFALVMGRSCDSVLTCVRQKRFFWTADGNPVNYDFRNRPRRQDFDGQLMENGAFYINTVGNIKRDKNRLSGRIGVYEMPDHTAVEIDDPDDWLVAANLFKKHVLSKQKGNLPRIKLFISDVDGVLTDAGMYYTENGDELKKFNTRDGMAFGMLRDLGIKTAIITSENTKMVERRAAKLKIDFLRQGHRNGGKLAAAQEICTELGISLHEVAYIGDDINCFELLGNVGLAACPADAVDKVKAIVGIRQLSKKGGDGAVREWAEFIMAHCV
jgi:YrbI family 3-deoxy-D-manno-octulosonate 8-phosphate phosphatase